MLIYTINGHGHSIMDELNDEKDNFPSLEKRGSQALMWPRIVTNHGLSIDKE
jgi:hypothetical protein